MKYVQIIATLLLLSGPSAAISSWKSGIGVGLQYGGIPGYQRSFYTGDNKYNFGVGLLGLSLGYERFITSNHSFGLHVYGVLPVAGASFMWNYYFNGKTKAGWRLGVEAGGIGGFGIKGGGALLVFPSIGYDF